MKEKITNETMANLADMVMNGEKPTHLGPRGRVVIELAINDILDIAKRLEYAGEALTEDEGSDGTAYRGDDGVRIDKVYHYLEAARDLVYTASDELADILRRADK